MKNVILIVMIFVLTICLSGCATTTINRKVESKVNNYAEEILNTQDESDQVLSILEEIEEKSAYGEKMDKLSKGERIIYLVGTVEGEVNNGGFSQYMFNSSGMHAKEAVEALKQIGANYTANILAKAIEVYGNGPTTDERFSKCEDLTPKQNKMLNELDNEFYAYKDNLYKMQMNFIIANINDFQN